MSKIFFSRLIPYLWRQKGCSPVLVVMHLSCDKDIDDTSRKILPEGRIGRICWDNTLYYLARPQGDSLIFDLPSPTIWGGGGARQNRLKGMPGLSTLNGVASSYGGLKKEDLAARYVRFSLLPPPSVQ